jgi:acetyl esterase
MTKKPQKPPFYRRKLFLSIAGGVLALIIIVMLAFRLSPWPGALIIRAAFTRGGSKTLKAMEAALPDYPVTVYSNQLYRHNDPAATMDVYIPNAVKHTQQMLPTVIWTHGGAWLSGDKTNDAPYFKRLANEGYTVIALNYSLAPGKKYPYALHQLNDAFASVLAGATAFHVNTNKIFLAGDSAGSQLSSQLAAITTNPAYAQEVGVQPSLKPSQLAGVILYCGIYKMEGLATPDPTLPKIVSWGDDVTVWAYSGTRDRMSPIVHQMSPYYFVTGNFPATFISGGNGDPLTDAQSKPLAQKLQSLGVPVTPLFYAQNHVPSLPHEYQFTFNADGENAFTQMTAFLQARTLSD